MDDGNFWMNFLSQPSYTNQKVLYVKDYSLRFIRSKRIKRPQNNFSRIFPNVTVFFIVFLNLFKHIFGLYTDQ